MFEPLPLAPGRDHHGDRHRGNIGYEGGFLPIKIPGLFPNGLPAIATAAVVGIVMNLVFGAIKPSAPPRVQPKAAIP